MTLRQYKDEFKTSFPWNETISIGKIDRNKEKALCFYPSKRNLTITKTINTSSYNIKPITILLRYTKNQDIAEIMASSIYEFFDERTFFIEEKQIIARHIYLEPITLGTDDNGVYEYSLEINFIEKR